MRFLFWVVIALVALILILFAISNRETVSLGLWLLPGAAIELPLYLLVLGTLVFGFVVGELVGWIGSWRWRREARRGHERIAALERELEAALAQHRDATVPVAVVPR